MVALSRDVEAIGELVAALPSDVDAALFVVLPIGTHRSELPFLLNQSGHLPASHAADGEPIGRGHIDVAPPDHHMVLEQGVIRLTRGRASSGRGLPWTRCSAVPRGPTAPM